MARMLNAVIHSTLRSSISQPFYARGPLVLNILGGTLSCFNSYKDQDRGNATIGGTPVISSRNPGWEPLPRCKK